MGPGKSRPHGSRGAQVERCRQLSESLLSKAKRSTLSDGRGLSPAVDLEDVLMNIYDRDPMVIT